MCLVSISLILASNYSTSLFIDFLDGHLKKIPEETSSFDYELLKAGLISYTAQVGFLKFLIFLLTNFKHKFNQFFFIFVNQLILVELLYLVTPSSSSTGSNTCKIYQDEINFYSY